MFVFPQSLFGLRDYLKGVGVDVTAFKSARQAAFMAQQLLNTRVKFPPPGQEMLPTLLTIQKAAPARGIVQQPTVSKAAPADLFGTSLKPGKAKGKPSNKAPQPAYLPDRRVSKGDGMTSTKMLTPAQRAAESYYWYALRLPPQKEFIAQTP